MRRCYGCFKQIDDLIEVCPYCGYNESKAKTDPLHLAPGTVLSGTYRIGKVLSHDNNYTTYIGWDSSYSVRVKITEFLPIEYVVRADDSNELFARDEAGSAAFDKGFLAFIEEAKRLDSAGSTPRLFDCIAENNTAYMIMEYSESDKYFANDFQAQQQPQPQPEVFCPAQPQEQPEEQPQEQPQEPVQEPVQEQPQEQIQNQPEQQPQPQVFRPAGDTAVNNSTAEREPEKVVFKKADTVQARPENTSYGRADTAVQVNSANANSKGGLIGTVVSAPLWVKILGGVVLAETIAIAILIPAAVRAGNKTQAPKPFINADKTFSAPAVIVLNPSSFSFKGHSYALFSNADTWEDAEKYCESLGGHLVTINSKEENDAVWAFARNSGYESVFIGLSDAEEEGTWKWVTGEPFTYTNWAEGQPDGFTEDENFAEFAFSNNNGKWNDYEFKAHKENTAVSYICEWDSDIKNSAGDTELTDEQAKTAFTNHLADLLYSENISEGVDFTWEFAGNDNGICLFNCTFTNGEYVCFYTDLSTGITSSIKYASSSCEDALAVEVSDYSAWDYLDQGSSDASSATDLKTYMRKDIRDSADKIGGLEEVDSEESVDFQNDDMFISTTKGNESGDIKYIQVRGNGKYSLYGIAPGMNWKEGVSRMIASGAVSAKRVDSKTVSVTLEDGTTIAVTRNASNIVTHVAVKVT